MLHRVIIFFVIVECFGQIHIANDNYFLTRAKRQAGVCQNGMSIVMRLLFDGTLGGNKTWDCTLEQTSSAVAQVCLSDNGGASNNTLKLSFPNTGNYTADNVLNLNEDALVLAASSVAQTVLGTLPYIGCSYAACTERVDILCLYSMAASPTTSP